MTEPQTPADGSDCTRNACADAGDTSDNFIDLRERNTLGACDAYFKARPELDTPANRDLFRSAYSRGFDSCERATARGQLAVRSLI
jgi:hypothetical protein